MVEPNQSILWQDIMSNFPTTSKLLPVFTEAEPECITIIPSYRCSASCPECCFSSSPAIKYRMGQNDLIRLIQNIRKRFQHLDYIVISGGEPTLLGNDLVDAIKEISSLDLGSRIVTNGSWAKSEDSTNKWITQLKAAGLNELNLSTGDEHQMFVPLDCVARAAYHSVQADILTLIVVEGKETSHFRIGDLHNHPLIKNIIEDENLHKNLILLTNVWVPFHTETNITNDKTKASAQGCDNIFENLAINPYGCVYSCCGLTMEYIQECKIGHIDSDDLLPIYQDQYKDIFKLWIWLDGTKYIFERLQEKVERKLEVLSPHACAICAQLYQTKEFQTKLIEIIEDNAKQIMFRAVIKAKMTGRIPNVLKGDINGQQKRSYPVMGSPIT